MEISSTLFAFSTTLLLLLLLIESSTATSRDQSSTATNTEFIRTSCVATTYPKLCFSSLSAHAAKIQTSPKLLATTALGVSLSSAEATSSSLRQLSHAVHRVPLRPREVAAMADCLEELADTVDELQKSAAEMEKMVAGKVTGPGSFAMTMSDVQTWVSAALTDETTCSDGFDEKSTASGELKTVVKGKIVNLAQLTSNALALINKYAKIHG